MQQLLKSSVCRSNTYKKAVPYLRPLAFQRGGPGLSPDQVMWDLWWTKWHWDTVSPTTSVSPANSHSTDCSTLITYHPGLVQ
jgi:hypothetical protein